MNCNLAASTFENTNPPSFHAVIDSEVFTVLGSKPSSFPYTPSRTAQLKPSPREPRLPDFFTPGWITSSLPFIGFVPSSSPFKCDFLRCLDYTAMALPIFGDAEHGYRLDLMLIADWDSLERNMRIFLRASMKVNRIGLPGDLRLWAYPRQYGYSRTFITEDRARAAANRSRQAFIPLIASVSFFLHLIYHLQDEWVNLIAGDPHIGLPGPSPFPSARQNEMRELRRQPPPSKWDWREKLRKETSISEEWLAYFYEIMDMPMVGFYMDVHHSNCLPWLPIFIKAKMPIALYWGTVKDWKVPLSVPPKLPVPTGDLIQTLITQQVSHSRRDTDLHFPVTTNALPIRAAIQLRLPRIDGGTQPRKNEGIFEFLQRRDHDRARSIASENPQSRQSRIQREENASKDMPPGRKGARVYYWDLVEGVRVRTAVGRSNYEDIWARYGSRQRRYDSVADEWDICTELDPDDHPLFWDEENDDDEDDDFFIPPQTIMDSEIDHHHGTASSVAYLARLCPPSTSDQPVSFTEEIDDVVKHRFGFISQTIHAERTTKLSSSVWGQALALIGYGRLPRPPLRNEDSEIELCAFLFSMLKAPDLKSAPKSFDLVNSQPSVPFEVDILPSHHCLYFLIQAPEAHDRESFVLALTSPSAVMEIARRNWGPRSVDILKNLIKGGFSFNTLSACHSSTGYFPLPRRQSVVLGYRPPEFSPGVDEYHSYEHRRNSFLRSVRGRAAILAGGLIARLARDVADVADVLDGPTNYALQGQNSLCVGSPRQNAVFRDDELTEDEVDLICGSYKVSTGIVGRDGEQQYAIKSWWPRPISWRSCGLNVGYWSSDAENWFQDHLKAIRDSTGSVKPLTNNQWRRLLKFNTDSPKLSQKIDHFSYEYLRHL